MNVKMRAVVIYADRGRGSPQRGLAFSHVECDGSSLGFMLVKICLWSKDKIIVMNLCQQPK